MKKYNEPFQVNQVWVSETNPEQDLFVYCVDYNRTYDNSYDYNYDSYVFTIKINKKAFENFLAKKFKYDSYSEIKRESIYPYSWWGEYRPSSLKQLIKKYNMKLLKTLNYEVIDYCNINNFRYHYCIKDIEKVIEEIRK